MTIRAETIRQVAKKIRWRLRALVLSGLLVAALATSGCSGPGTSALPIVQPIAFSHNRHVSGKDGIKCDACHTGVDNQIFAGIPQVDRCMDCHATVTRMKPQKLAKKPELAKLKGFVAAGFIPWQRIYRQPDYVFFSHRRHVVVGKIECVSCHGAMNELTAPLAHPVVNQSMDWCMNCHEERNASRDCIACHK